MQLKTRTISSAFALFAPFLMAASAAAQQTLVVPTGYPTIQAAITAASPGDTVEVLQGTYPGSFSIDKGIHLRGIGAVLTGALLSQVQIAGVPAGQTLTVRGFSVDPNGVHVRVTVGACDGAVRLTELQGGLRRWQLSLDSGAQVHVRSVLVLSASVASGQVVFERTIFDGNDFVIPLGVSGGQVVVNVCSVGGGNTFANPGILQNGGQLAVTRSSISGAGLVPQPAISVVDGLLLLDPSVTLTPGSGQPGVLSPSGFVTTEFASLATEVDALGWHLEDHGPAGALFVTVASPAAPSLPTALGVAWVDPTALIVLDGGVYPPNRLAARTIAGPSLPAGTSLSLQSVVFDGGISLSLPSVARVP